MVLNLILVTSVQMERETVDGSTPILSVPVGNSTNHSGANTVEPVISNTTEIGANSNLTRIFDGKTLDGWIMAGDGKFLIL